MHQPPEDFDLFWKEICQQLDEVLPEYTLTIKNEKLPFVACYELVFKSHDDSLIYSKLVVPTGLEKCPLVIKFHGYQGQSSDWSEAFKFTAAGIGVVMMDVRGQSGYSHDNGIHKYNTVKGQIVRGMKEGANSLAYVDIYKDVYLLVNVVSQLSWVDMEHVYTWGESQGGALALIAAALSDKVKKTFSVYPFLSDFGQVIKVANQTEPYDELFRYFKFHDPMYDSYNEVISTLGYIDVKNFAHLIKGQVTMLCGLKDEICLPETQYAIYNRLTTSDKEMLVFPEYGHEAINVKYPDKVFEWAANIKMD
ncbi:acetylxylan esterase [Vagococcus zengguangii]|uniref:Acetylxylan esterase n=2 Tax=Vagococcus zengguangii TaxID=2571750 RepID=A0A4D7CY20_9ENTE|nr:acetylxylan esterase [Vagococcus zengguangii]TLG80796.1 acetylxylan esterase [Vagococcus zengguangii]